jgi:UPF0755 protein
MRGDIIPPKRPDSRPSVRTPFAATDNAADNATPLERADNPSPQLPDRIAAIVQDIAAPEPDKEPRTHKWPSKKRLIATIVGIGIALLVVLVAAGLLWYDKQLTAVNPSNDEKVKITIEQGAGVPDIAQTLKDNQLIRNTTVFEWYVRQQGKTSQLQSGAYRLSQSEDVAAIVKHLTTGQADTFSVTFLPGATLDDHRTVLLDAGYSEANVDTALQKQYDHPLFSSKPASADLEGYIYGETFNFAASATPEEILLYNFDYYYTVIEDNELVAKYKKQGFTLFQAITMASIIQREVATPEDAAQVAQVFKKRFDMGMQLGSDVTYQYIADKTGQERSVDLDSPYNTRRYVGLPPGPIASPGLASLKAVASPAPGDFLYFLSGDDDKTYFARTNEEHERNIKAHCEKKCQII